MAGEWIAYDLSLPDKPEVQELVDETGREVEFVVFSLLRLWGWAAMNTTDGKARMTVPRLVRTCGADEAFWRAVAAVGWLEIDETAATVAIPRWDRRFSQAAKARIQHQDRAAASRERAVRSSAPTPCAQAHQPRALKRTRGEERREEVPPPPREASPWEEFRTLWNAGPGRPWKPTTPPEGLWDDRTKAPEWYDQAVEALGRLGKCRFFTQPVTLPQFLGPKFVGLCLGGQYDAPKAPRPGEPEARAPAGWTGDDAARFEATKRKMIAQLQAEAG